MRVGDILKKRVIRVCILTFSIFTLASIFCQKVQAKEFNYTGQEVKVKDIEDNLSSVDIVNILNKRKPAVGYSLASVLADRYNKQDMPEINTSLDTIGGIDGSKPSGSYIMGNGNLIPFSRITFQDKTGYPTNASGHVDFSILVDTGVFPNAKYPEFQYPVDRNRASSLGKKIQLSRASYRNGHNGLDMPSAASRITGEDGSASGKNFNGAGNTGASVNLYAIGDGKITSFGYSASAGNWLVVESTAHDGKLIQWVYMHMVENGSQVTKLKAGDSIKKGQYVGKTGNTGYSGGTHLHFEVWFDSRRFTGTFVNPLYLYTPESVLSLNSCKNTFNAIKNAESGSDKVFAAWLEVEGFAIQD